MAHQIYFALQNALLQTISLCLLASGCPLFPSSKPRKVQVVSCWMGKEFGVKDKQGWWDKTEVVVEVEGLRKY